MRPKKSLGQNFLMHARIAERIADAASLNPSGTVLEIGPGTGMLTKALLARSKQVIAVEADHELVETLKETFKTELSEGKLTLIQADIRTFDTLYIKEEYALVANIPYYITGEITRQFLTAPHKPTSMTLLVQKEVAERIARSKKESLLSLSVKVFGTPKYCFTVPKGAFFPAPKVDSAVLSIANIQNPFAEGEEQRFFDILHAGFAHKRKLLAGNLRDIASSDAIVSAFAAAHLPEKARAEDVSLPAWRSLVRYLQ